MRRKVVRKWRDLHNAPAELGRFISICAQARMQLDPENIKTNVGRTLGGWLDGLDEDSKSLVRDLGGKLRLPR